MRWNISLADNTGGGFFLLLLLLVPKPPLSRAFRIKNFPPATTDEEKLFVTEFLSLFGNKILRRGGGVLEYPRRNYLYQISRRLYRAATVRPPPPPPSLHTGIYIYNFWKGNTRKLVLIIIFFSPSSRSIYHLFLWRTYDCLEGSRVGEESGFIIITIVIIPRE